jgi:SWI/SNF-related matrix-associated actin-dependent regulator of chromatin subfamily A containing DEAD/H box 1
MLKHFVEAHRVNSGSKNGSNSGDDDGYAAAYKKLKQLFSPFVLRRRKVDVLSQIMPPKERTVEFVTLNEASRAVYDSVLYNHINAKKKRGTGSNSGTDHLFTQLRKAAHHPLLLRTRYTSATEKEHLNRCFHSYGAFRGAAATLPKVADQLEKFNDFDIHVTALDLIAENPCRKFELDRYVLDAEDLFSSPKFVRLRALLPQLVADGHRVLIFSVWTSCLDLLTCLMDSLNMGYIRMQGDTAVHERQGLIDKFNNDPSIPVFLLSTTACGLGINLVRDIRILDFFFPRRIRIKNVV